MSSKITENRRKRVAKIFILAKEKGIDNELLHTIIYEKTHKESIKDLSEIELLEIIEVLKGESKKQIRQKFSQDDYIQSLVMKLKVESPATYLSGIMKRMGKSDYSELSVKDKSRIIEALKDILKRQCDT